MPRHIKHALHPPSCIDPLHHCAPSYQTRFCTHPHTFDPPRHCAPSYQKRSLCPVTSNTLCTHPHTFDPPRHSAPSYQTRSLCPVTSNTLCTHRYVLTLHVTVVRQVEIDAGIVQILHLVCRQPMPLLLIHILLPLRYLCEQKCVCVCVCVRVCMRAGMCSTAALTHTPAAEVPVRTKVCVCVCVCMCTRVYARGYVFHCCSYTYSCR